jgi:hypothetical protein
MLTKVLVALGLMLTISASSALAQEVKGQVKDSTGTPVAGAKVLALGTNDTTYTDATGHYTLELPPGNYAVCTAKPGYVSACTTGVQVDAPPSSKTVNFILYKNPDALADPIEL